MLLCTGRRCTDELMMRRDTMGNMVLGQTCPFTSKIVAVRHLVLVFFLFALNISGFDLT